MGFWRRRGADDKPQINVTVVNSPTGASADLDEEERGDEEQDLKEAQAAHALEVIKSATSIRTRVRKLFADYGWLTIVFFVLGVIVFPAEWWLVLATTILFNLGMFAYTKWVYKPPVVPLVRYDDDGTGGVLGAWLIPVEIWDKVAKQGLSNTIRTSLGTTHLVRSIAFADDEERVPVAVEFAWIHFNELNFATKRGMFDEIRNELKVVREQNNRYKWLMENMVLTRALSLVTRWISIMSHGRYSALADQDKASLRHEIEQMAAETNRNRMPALMDTPLTETSGENEGV